MNYTKPFKQLLKRSSFKSFLPVMAFLVSVVAASLFAVFYTWAVFNDASHRSDTAAERVAELVAQDISTGNRERLHGRINALTHGSAYVSDLSGDVIAGDASVEARLDGARYPVRDASGETVALLVTLPLVPARMPLPFFIMAAFILTLSFCVFLIADYFTRLATRHVEIVTALMESYEIGRVSERKWGPVFFTEFRRLKIAIARTSRRLRREVKRLREAAFVDERTGLRNAQALNADLRSLLARSSFERPLGLILCDIDNFARLSETHGGILANDLIRMGADRVRRFVETTSQAKNLETGSWRVYSLDSGEFAVLADTIGSRDDLGLMVNGLRSAFRAPFDFAGRTTSLTLSVGIVILPQDGQTASEALQRADAALSQARREETTGVRFYTPKLDRQAEIRAELESQLRTAVEQNEFQPAFQPKIDLRTGRITGCEALARWTLPNGRNVSPALFIPLAEESGLVRRIGEQIMAKSCRAATGWVEAGHRDVSLAVNVSPRQFEEDGLCDMVIDTLSRTGLPPRLLELEITESVAVSDPEGVREIMNPLRALGVKFAIDDFGTGHSNLSILSRLEFDVFKIDRQFIASLHADRQAPAIVEMILGMAETLGMETVAEGVETKPQADFLTRRGCKLAQGFLYSPPVSEEKFRRLLTVGGGGRLAEAV